MRNSLNNKVVIITGASGGIGRSIALLLAKEGASLVLAARRKELLVKLLNDLEYAQRHMVHPTDISKEEDVSSLISEVIKKYGKIDILINNAAVSYIGRVKDMKLEKAESALDINLLGTIRMTRHVLPYMVEQKSGHIITISSVIGKRGVPYRSIYCASKFGVEGFMESLRAEVDKYNIKVTIVRPPSVRTDFSKKIEPDSDVEHHALDNLDPDTVAKTVANVTKRPGRDVNMGLLANGFLFLNGIWPGLFDRIVKER